jgi:hypothetical protein
MHNSLKIIKTLMYSYSALHVSGTLAPIIRGHKNGGSTPWHSGSYKPTYHPWSHQCFLISAYCKMQCLSEINTWSNFGHKICLIQWFLIPEHSHGANVLLDKSACCNMQLISYETWYLITINCIMLLLTNDLLFTEHNKHCCMAVRK